MRRYWQYLKYVCRHKYHVFRACLALGVPLWIAIFHDWDKFLPDEFLPYARTFYAPDGTKQYVEGVDFARAWMKHQHRNKHHWQYWLNCDGIPLPKRRNIIVWDRGIAQMIYSQFHDGKTEWVLCDVEDYHIEIREPMPDVYRREMLADWRGAGLALGFPDTAGWYVKNRDNIKLHSETRAWIEQQLGVYESELVETW